MKNPKKATDKYVEILLKTRERTSRIRIRLWEMDSAEISNILREVHRNKIKWRTSSEDIKAKKVCLLLGKT